MIVLSLVYTLFFIANINYLHGFDKLNFNLPNDIASLASYLKEHDLTIIDSDNKRILYFIVNNNVTDHFRTSVNYNEIAKRVEKIDVSIRSGSGYARSFGSPPDIREKIAYVDEFMKSHVLSTAYLYNELQRIKRTHVVKDGLRKMISFIEKPENEWVKKKVFQCFIDARKKV